MLCVWAGPFLPLSGTQIPPEQSKEKGVILPGCLVVCIRISEILIKHTEAKVHLNLQIRFFMGGDWMCTVNSPHDFYVYGSVTKNGGPPTQIPSGTSQELKPCISFFFPFIFISWRLITLQYCSGNPVFQWIQDLSITEIPLFHVFVNKKTTIS